jgi:anti-anti-sigma factor
LVPATGISATPVAATPIALLYLPVRIGPFLTAAPGRISVEGEVDRTSVELLRQEGESQLEEHGTSLVLDLSRTTFMDSAGLRLIEALHRLARERGGELVVVVASYPVRRLLELAPPPASVRVILEHAAEDLAA